MANFDTKPQTKKEKKDLARELREKEKSTGNMQGKLVKIALFAVVISLIGGAIYLYTKPAPKKPEIGQTFEKQGAQHITQGETSNFKYNSNPPTSGPHWSNPAGCQIYEKEIADESVIHSLEHGAVWVSYRDKDDLELRKKLEDLVKNKDGKLLLSPRAKNDSKIAVASWTRLLKLEEFDGRQIEEFIKYHTNQSPEPLASCPKEDQNK